MKRQLNFQRYRWQLREHAAALGWPAMLALIVALAAAGATSIVMRPLGEQIVVAQQRLVNQRKAQSVRLTQLPPANGATEQLRQFHQFFPDRNTLPGWLAKLYETATENGVALDQGQYQLSHDAKGAMWRYEIVLPVRGTYPQVRKFIAQTLGRIPHLALQSISFERQKVGDAMLEANIRLTLYLGDHHE